MQIIFLFILMVATLLLQGSLRILGFPDLMLALVIAYVVKRPQTGSLIFSFTGGFFEDSLYSGSFINTFIKTSVSIIATYLKMLLVLDEDKMCIVLACILTPVSIILTTIAANYFFGDVHVNFSILNIIFATMVNAIIAPMFYVALGWIYSDEQ